MSQTAVVDKPSRVAIAAVFNLDDPAERRIVDAIQGFYEPGERYRLHALRRGAIAGHGGLVRMVWTLGSFLADCPDTCVEWTVVYWYIDEIAVRFRHCPNEAAARAVYKHATHPDAELPGIRLKR